MKCSLTLFLFFIYLLPAYGQEEFQLPEGGGVNGWQKAGPVREFRGDDLFNHINGGAELFHEYGFETLFVQRYSNQGDELTLELYRMESPKSAFGIYLVKAGQETPSPGLPVRNTINNMQLTAVKGVFFIRINSLDMQGRLRTQMEKLASSVVEKIPEKKNVSILNELPQDNLIEDSEMLFRGPIALEPVFTFGEGDIFLQERMIWGVLADYTADGSNRVTRLFIDYPTYEKATKAFQHVKENLDSYLTVISDNDSAVVFRDYEDKFGLICLKQKRIDLRIHLQTAPDTGSGREK